MADVNLNIHDFMAMFNVGKSDEFSTSLKNTHGMLTLGTDGKLRNVGRYDRGKTNYLELERSSASTKSKEGFRVRAALIQALKKDVAGIDSDYLIGIYGRLGMSQSAKLNDQSAESAPLSRRTVKEILDYHRDYKVARERRLSEANRPLAESFTWDNQQQEASFRAMLMHTGNGRPAKDLFGVGENHEGRDEILQVVREMAQDCKSYDQKRIFLSFVFSEWGSKALNTQWKNHDGTDAIRKTLQRYEEDAAVFSGKVPSEYLDGWCSFLVARREHQPLNADDIQFVNTALDNLAVKMPKLKGKKTLSPKDVNELSKIIVPPKDAYSSTIDGVSVLDTNRWVLVQDALSRIACECGILNREMRRGILSNEKIGVTIDGMLNEFEAHVSDDVNKWIRKGDVTDENVAKLVEGRSLKNLEEVSRRAYQHIQELRTIAELLYGVDDDATFQNQNAYRPLTSDTNEEYCPWYCETHYKRKENKGKPINNLKHMQELLKQANAFIAAYNLEIGNHND